jgi:membrane associated rhomboid family serine protease
MSLDAQREPLFRGPWPVWTIAGLILASYAVQSGALDLETAAVRYGVSAVSLAQGRWFVLVSALFIHGGWAHAAMNTVGALAFGAPAARLFGLQAKGAVGFFAFYLCCGVLGNLGYVALHPHDALPLVGASGAVSGLFGGASRLIEHRPYLSPFRSRTVLTSLAAWVVVNVLLGLMHYAPGIGDAQVGWEAHIAGYIAGLVLIGPFARFLAPPRQTSPDV